MAKKTLTASPEDVRLTQIDPIDKNEANIEEVDLSDLIKLQEGEFKRAEADRADFVSKQGKWFRQRYGLRKKATFPWYNSSSQHLPLQDKHIRELKPEYVGVAYNTFPMCELTVSPEAPNLLGQNTEAVNAILTQQAKENNVISEAASFHFDWLLRTRMDIFEPLCLMADKMLEKGFCIVKSIYEKSYEPKVVSIFLSDLKEKVIKSAINKQEAENFFADVNRIGDLMQMIARSYLFDLEDENDWLKCQNICLEIYKGTDVIEFTVQEIKYDAPKWIVLDPTDVIVPVDTESTFDLEKARWICHQYYVTLAEVMINMRSGKWKEEACKKLLGKAGVYDEDMAEAKYMTSGKAVKDSNMLIQKRTREGVAITTETDKNILIKEFCMWYDEDGDGIEERHVLEYAEGATSELRFIRYPYSMKMWPFVKVPFSLEDTRHYAPRGTVEIEEPMATALNVQHNMKINRQTIASTPTLIYAANKVNPNNFQYIPGQAVPVEPPLNANVQWFMPPSNDATFMNEEAVLKGWSNEIIAAQSFGDGPANQSGTAKEYSGIANARVGIRQLDIQIWQKALKELYVRTFLLEMEFSSEKAFTYMDNDGTQKQIDRAALSRDYMFQPMGSFGSSNPQLSAQVATRMFEMFRGDPEMDQYELKREFIVKQGDARMAKRILKDKQTIAQEGQQAQKAARAAHEQQLREAVMLAQAGVKMPQQSSGGTRQQPKMQQIGQQRVGG